MTIYHLPFRNLGNTLWDWEFYHSILIAKGGPPDLHLPLYFAQLFFLAARLEYPAVQLRKVTTLLWRNTSDHPNFDLGVLSLNIRDVTLLFRFLFQFLKEKIQAIWSMPGVHTLSPDKVGSFVCLGVEVGCYKCYSSSSVWSNMTMISPSIKNGV